MAIFFFLKNLWLLILLKIDGESNPSDFDTGDCIVESLVIFHISWRTDVLLHFGQIKGRRSTAPWLNFQQSTLKPSTTVIQSA